MSVLNLGAFVIHVIDRVVVDFKLPWLSAVVNVPVDVFPRRSVYAAFVKVYLISTYVFALVLSTSVVILTYDLD